MCKSQRCLTLIFVELPAASCTVIGASDGMGYALLHPSDATRTSIVENDKSFTLELAAHNGQRGRDPMCGK